MSYDLYAFRPVAGEDLSALARSKLAQESGTINRGGPSDEAEARKNELAQALLTANPLLARIEFDYTEIAQFENISEDEARRRYRHIEMNGPADGNGIQITLYDDRASISVPYWHQSAAARAVFDEIGRYIRILKASGGFFIYDPQIGRVLDLASDLPDVLNTYGSVVAKLAESVQTTRADERPWWKFWSS